MVVILVINYSQFILLRNDNLIPLCFKRQNFNNINNNITTHIACICLALIDEYHSKY